MSADGDDFSLVDASVSPVAFPIASGTSTVTLKCPVGYCGVRLDAMTQDIKVGKGVSGQYKTIAAHSYMILPMTPGNTLAIERAVATAVEGFWIKVASDAAVKFGIGYDPDTQAVKMIAWLEGYGQVITDPTSVRVTARDSAGTTLFDVSSSSPNARGKFILSQSAITFVAGTAYEVAVEIVYNGVTYEGADVMETFS